MYDNDYRMQRDQIFFVNRNNFNNYNKNSGVKNLIIIFRGISQIISKYILVTNEKLPYPDLDDKKRDVT